MSLAEGTEGSGSSIAMRAAWAESSLGSEITGWELKISDDARIAVPMTETMIAITAAIDRLWIRRLIPK